MSSFNLHSEGTPNFRIFFLKGEKHITMECNDPSERWEPSFKVQNLPSSKAVDKTGCRTVGDFKTRYSTYVV